LVCRNLAEFKAPLQAVKLLNLGWGGSIPSNSDSGPLRTCRSEILPLRQLDLGGGHRIDGVGTTLFYHFLATMDYPNGQVVLRRKNMRSQRRFTEASSDSVVVPFWIAGDHFMVGWG
jgi:hypothetical protein